MTADRSDIVNQVSLSTLVVSLERVVGTILKYYIVLIKFLLNDWSIF